MTDEEIRVGFRVDLAGLQQGLAQANARLDHMQTKAKATGNRFVSSIQEVGTAANLVKAGMVGAAVAVGVEVSKVSVSLARFAQSADDVHDYFKSSFGGMTRDATEWARQLSQDYQIYEEEIMQFSGRLNQAYLTSGQTQAQAMAMTKDMTKMSYDLTRYFSDLSLEEIQQAMLDMATGEAGEAFKKLGISMDENSIRARAVSYGIAQVGEEMTVAQKQATGYRIIMEELSDAQGAYGDAVWNVGNVTADWNRSVNELKESVGTALRPAVVGLAKVVIEFMDYAQTKVDRFNRTMELAATKVKSFINDVANRLGKGDVFNMTEAVGPTKALDRMMANIKDSAEGTEKAVAGLMGFDKLNILKSQPEAKEATVDAKAGMSEWIELFRTNPQIASGKLDPLWNDIMSGNFDTVQELRKQYGKYFDWVLEEEAKTNSLTNEQKIEMMDKFYQDLFDQVKTHGQLVADLNSEYDRKIAAYRLLQEGMTLEELRSMNMSSEDMLNEYGFDMKDAEDAYRLQQEGVTLDQIEAMRTQDLETMGDATRLKFKNIWAKILEDFGVISSEIAKVMYTAFETEFGNIEIKFNTMTESMKADLEELNSQLSSAEDRLAYIKSEADKNWVDRVKDRGDGSFWRGAADVIKEQTSWSPLPAIGTAQYQMEQLSKKKDEEDLPHFAVGGVFEPNHPMPVIVGDHHSEREVIAPESMIENAVLRALGSMNLSRSERQIVLKVDLDSREIARTIYKPLKQEAMRRGTF